MTKMENILPCPIIDSTKKKQWIKPEIRTLAHDDPLVQHFQSLTKEQHDVIFSYLK